VNKDRRKDIDVVLDAISTLIDSINAIQDGEQEFFDNMPEGLQGSEKGDRAAEVIDTLNNAHMTIELAMGDIEECKE